MGIPISLSYQIKRPILKLTYEKLYIIAYEQLLIELMDETMNPTPLSLNPSFSANSLT